MYVASRDVRYREIDGNGIIIDLRNQRYVGLDDRSTAMWSCLTGQGDITQQIDRWMLDYEISLHDMRRAIDDFRGSCLAMGWLERERVAGPKASMKAKVEPIEHSGLYRWMPGAMLAYLALSWTALSLKIKGFENTYHSCGKMLVVPRPRARLPLTAVLQPFLFAENAFAFRRAPDDCLGRSLALFRYLRWRGVPAAHVIGVRRIPFAAHAWVEVDDAGVLAPRPQGFMALATLTSQA